MSDNVINSVVCGVHLQISMSFTWRISIQLVLIVSFWTITVSSTSSSDWKEVERLAEDHPYIVAVLDNRNQYVCTGVSISEHTVLTAGSCLDMQPTFIALSAVLGDDIVGKNVLLVSHTMIHSSFSCYVSQTQPSETVINSNIGLVYVRTNKLDYFANLAVFGDFGPIELRKKKLTVVGHGELDLGAIALQRQVYIQKTCVNPQWYYCVCGVESSESTYENQFGEGGPVVLDNKVVAIAAAPCGALIIPHTDVKFNIFTVVMQYHSWILRHQQNVTVILRQRLKSVPTNGVNHVEVSEASFIAMLLIVIDKLIN